MMTDSDYPPLFEEAFDLVVVQIEKGYVNNKYDRGGETKYGISKKTYPDLDIPNLTLHEAKKIYFYDFWNEENLTLPNVKDREIAIELFDTAVNMSPRTAGIFLQRALNNMNRNQRIYKDMKEDGWIGAVTLSNLELILKRAEKAQLLKILNGEQYAGYKTIIENNPEQEINFVGWMKRV
ncbi:MAG: glycoside hydrolase family 108 protein [Candidatus Paceibacteria bacterium]